MPLTLSEGEHVEPERSSNLVPRERYALCWLKAER